MAIQADVVGREPDALLLTGNQSGPSAQDFRARRAWLSRFALPAIATVGPGESDGRDRFVELHGVGPLDNATWGAVDLVVSGVTWRLISVDATATGDAWQDQLFWLPKAASQEQYAHLVLLTGVSPYTLAEREATTDVETANVRRSRELLEAIESHAGLGRLRAVIGGSTLTQEAILPAGPWGEIWLNAGTSGLPGVRTSAVSDGPRKTEIRLASGLQDELGEGPAPSAWWELVLDGSLVSLRLRKAVREDRFEEVWRIHWSADEGWTRAVQ